MCCRSMPWPDLMPTSSRKRSGLFNGARRLDGLTTRSAKQQEYLQADKDSTIHALLYSLLV